MAIGLAQSKASMDVNCTHETHPRNTSTTWVFLRRMSRGIVTCLVSCQTHGPTSIISQRQRQEYSPSMETTSSSCPAALAAQLHAKALGARILRKMMPADCPLLCELRPACERRLETDTTSKYKPSLS